MLENMPETVTPIRRIVLLHSRGPYAGLHQIMGTTADFGGKQPPAVTDAFTITPGTRVGQASLMKSTPRYLLFKELPA
jgi:hypothetical protein